MFNVDKIPHLKLNVPFFDYNKAIQELECLENRYVPIKIGKSPLWSKDKPSSDDLIDHPTWSSRALVNYTYDSDKYFSFFDRDESTIARPDLQPIASKKIQEGKRPNGVDMFHYKTEIYDKMPYITEYIEKLYNKSNRILIWKLAAGGSIPWHNHTTKAGKEKTTEDLILHIPIVTHPDIEMCVKIDDVIYKENYQPGSVYLFNSTNDHAVFNNTEVDRIHIVIMVPSDDKILNKLLEQSYEQYSYN